MPHPESDLINAAEPRGIMPGMHRTNKFSTLASRFLFGSLLTIFVAQSSLGQYSPDHPKVVTMVDRAIKFLEEAKGRTAAGFQAGENILVGYTLFKVTGDDKHPKVQLGINAATQLANSLGRSREPGEKVVYEASLGAVLLATVDAAKFRPQLLQTVNWLGAVQKPHGGFGYLDRPTGDTSQVQYAILAMWTLHEAGLEIPTPLVEGTLRYLVATADPSGAWGYQGRLGNGRLVKQEDVSKSLATAGIGATIIGGDILGFYGERKKAADEDDGIPEAFERIDLKEKLRAERKELTMSRSDTDGIISLGARFQNSVGFTGGPWYYYWRYSQERYESFVEIVQGKQSKSPGWYNDGVNQLAAVQAADGSWGGDGDRFRTATMTQHIDTSLAVLFLIRSTQKAIGKLDEGLTFGGYQLPGDVSQIKMVGDKVVSDAETSVENLLEMLEADGDDVQAGLLPDDLQLATDPKVRKQQVARLSRLLSSGDYSARRIAAKLLGRSEDLDLVPDLIYALTDPDPEVPRIAEESLRLLSRKLTAGKLAAAPTAPQREAAVKFWKEWYLGLRPDYIFIER